MKLKVVRTMTVVEMQETDQQGRPADPPMLRAAAVLVVENPFAGRYVEDLKPYIDASIELGEQMGKMIVKAIGPYKVESYGKAGIVGTNGEQEHANALLTTTFADPIRRAIGGGKAWISSMTKIATPGMSIDVPMNHKDAVYVRSHYNGMSLTLHDSPAPNEIALIFAVANRGRLNARVGGLRSEDVKGLDGLV